MRSKCKRRRINNAASAPYLTGSGSALNMSLSYDVWNSEKTPVETPAKTPVIELPAASSPTSPPSRGCDRAGEDGHKHCVSTVECALLVGPYEVDYDPWVMRAASPTNACQWCEKAKSTGNPCLVHDIDAICGGPSRHMVGTFVEAEASRNCTPPE